MRRFLTDLVIIAVVLVVIYGVILHITPDFGRSLFSSLTRQPSVEVFYLTHTEVDTVTIYMDRVIKVPAEVTEDPETEQRIFFGRYSPEADFIRGWVDVEFYERDLDFVFREHLEVDKIETVHYVTEIREITLPPRWIRPKIGAAYGVGDERRDIGGGSGVFLFDRVDVLGEIHTNRYIWLKVYYTF